MALTMTIQLATGADAATDNLGGHAKIHVCGEVSGTTNSEAVVLADFNAALAAAEYSNIATAIDQVVVARSGDNDQMGNYEATDTTSGTLSIFEPDGETAFAGDPTGVAMPFWALLSK